MTESDAFKNVAQAEIHIDLDEGRIYNLTVTPLELRFLVTAGNDTDLGGVFYYNNLDDIKGKVKQVGTTAVIDDKLAVRFGTVALFISSENIPDNPPPINNSGDWITWHAIEQPLVSKDTWVEKSKEVQALVPPDPPADLVSSTYWMQPAIRNETGFYIRFSKCYVSAGHYNDTPDASIAPFTLRTFDGEGTTQGFAGALTYEVEFDPEWAFTFSCGFATNAANVFKAGVAVSTNPQDGYKAASTSGGVITSEEYEAVDQNGKPVVLHIRVTATVSGPQPAFVVEEVRAY
ncbi:hypothetical protein FA15DRAFT_670922 [Coprinopsis marcescibilis]|uniref:Uncharacterized protein n=1 Tax=Coprinopsis marcescibilis TaxID=230819 RepID=A0A5C3KT17_COPMA|nr:hypothetical protein FA15DRAFT_670922 [Coprinopsis marcescibilis]